MERLRTGSWASRDRLWLWGAALVLVWLAWTVLFGFIGARSGPVDFLAFWTAGDMVLDGQGADVYDVAAHHAHYQTFTEGRDEGILPYLSPPHFLFPAVALGSVDYFVAYTAWIAFGAALYSWIAWRILPDRLTVLVALAAPPTAFNFVAGQTGFLIAAASAVALLDGEKHPWRSAVALAILTFKPQFGVLIGIALLMTGAWSAVLRGLALSVAAIGASAAIFGPSRWLEFLGVGDTVTTLSEIGRVEQPFAPQSLLPILRGLDVPNAAAIAVHVLFASIVAIVVLRRVWARGLTLSTIALVLVGTHLVSPRMYSYDLQFIGLAALCLVAAALRASASDFLYSGIALVGLLAALSAFGLPTGFIAMVVLLWLGTRQAERERGEPNGRMPAAPHLAAA